MTLCFKRHYKKMNRQGKTKIRKNIYSHIFDKQFTSRIYKGLVT